MSSIERELPLDTILLYRNLVDYQVYVFFTSQCDPSSVNKSKNLKVRLYIYDSSVIVFRSRRIGHPSGGRMNNEIYPII